MFRHAHPVALLISAALLAGCGGSSDSANAPKSPIKAGPQSSTGGGELRVGATDIGIGVATSGDAGGLHVLPNTKVPGSSHTQQGVGAGATCENADLQPAAENTADIVAATLCLLNGERADAGLGALKVNNKLNAAAAGHSQEMVEQQYFEHIGKDGSDPVDRIRNVGYIPRVGTWTVGENLAWGTGTLATPKGIVAAWMKSQGHRENVLRPAFKEIGFGVIIGNPRSTDGAGATYTTTFGGVHRVRTAHRRRARTARRLRRARIAKGARASRKKSGTR
ncbi:MAG: hypothetical protein QOI80_2084 [Solirubrobacteraceae bacterium]|jgi:uncharacterized protein YkwD|nr:hypothetical protein [Solirubrobacteraceae bacterium]